MICGEDDEYASDKNTGAIGLELEQSQRSRSVPQWAAHYGSSKDDYLPKYKKKKKTLLNLETLSWSAYQCLVLIVCEDQELIANEVFCHRSCYANYTHPEKLQRIQDATPPATDSATSQ